MASDAFFCYVTRVTAMPGGKVIVGLRADKERNPEISDADLEKIVSFYAIDSSQREMLAVALAAITSNMLVWVMLSSSQDWPPPDFATVIERLSVVTG